MGFARVAAQQADEADGRLRRPQLIGEALRGAHAALGLEIDEWTATPDWDGNRLDLDQVLRALLRRNERIRAET